MTAPIVMVAALTAISVLLAMWPTSRSLSPRQGDPLRWAARWTMERRPRRWFGGAARVAKSRARVREGTADLAAELRAGQPLRRALARAYDDSIAPRARSAARFGGDVAAALRDDARPAGRSALASVAACWSVAEGNGAGLATALERLVDQERESEDVRVQLAAHLAAPRATSRMLMLLPLIGVGLGFALGADPLTFLLGSPMGNGCLVIGVGLILLGLWWTSRIVHRVEALL